jgi:bifunctional non-homologous end joining protein LigD
VCIGFATELVAEVKYLTWTDENLIRQVVYEGLREDKPATEVRRLPPHPKPAAPKRQPIFANRQRSKRLPVPAENILQLLPDAVVPSRQELAAYWESVADHALRYLGRGPLKLVRHTKETTFYHMGPLPEIPPAVNQLRLEKRKGGTGTRLWVQDLAGSLGLGRSSLWKSILGAQRSTISSTPTTWVSTSIPEAQVWRHYARA